MADDETVSNPVTNGVATGRTVFDFGYDVVNSLWTGPISYGIGLYREGGKVRELKESLGEWEPEAKDEKGRWQQPVLSLQAFCQHLVSEDARFQPSGECKASFGWAKLLYALNIQPKKGSQAGVITWRLASEGGLDPATDGCVSLAVDGAVICHIVNLYQLYTGASPNSDGLINFPFGQLQPIEEDAKSYYFKSFDSSIIGEVRQPFRFTIRERNRTRDETLRFETGTVVTSYFQTLDYGINKANLGLTEVQGPLSERVGLLLNSLDEFAKRDWNDPYLITPSWINHASRVKRLATTNRGRSNLLLCHIQKFISKDNEVKQRLQDCLQDESEWESVLAATLRNYFMFEDDNYEFKWNLSLELSSRENAQFTAIVQSQLLPALEALSSTPEGEKWIRTGPDAVPVTDLLRLLNTPHRILNQPVIVLQHMPDNWTFSAQILG